MSTRTHEYLGVLEVIECAGCHMDFGILPRFQKDRRADHRHFWCPDGHSNYYPQESEAERLRRQLKARDDLLASAREQRDAKDRSLRATRGHVTRLKNRAVKGKCPCCSQSFEDLAEHMAEDHPGYGGDAT